MPTDNFLDHPRLIAFREVVLNDPVAREKAVDSGSIESLNSLNHHWHVIMNHTKGNPLGVEIKHKIHDKWIIIAPNETEESKAIVSYFDKHGFDEHKTVKNAVEALKVATEEGYWFLSEGVLDDVSRTHAWELGTRRAEIIKLFNANVITLSELVKRFNELEAEFKNKKVLK